jgi:hypothetical protein
MPNYIDGHKIGSMSYMYIEITFKLGKNSYTLIY